MGSQPNYVYGVLEDDEGMIWVYTERGISKFNGYTFQNHTVKEGLSGNDIPFAHKSPDGRIWLFVFNNIPSYIKNNKIHQIDGNYQFLKNTINNYPTYIGHQESIYCLPDTFLRLPHKEYRREKAEILPEFFKKEISIDHNTRKKRLALHKMTVNKFKYRKEKFGLSIPKLEIFPEGIFDYEPPNLNWYGFDGKKTTFENTPLYHPPKVKNYFFDYFHSQLTPEIFLFRERNKFDFYLFNVKEQTQKRIDIREEGLYPRLHAKFSVFDSTFILNTDKGFLQYDFEGNLLQKFYYRDLDVSYNFMRAFVDSKKNLWIGSKNGGLFFFPNNTLSTKTIRSSELPTTDFFQEFTLDPAGNLLVVSDQSRIFRVEKEKIKLFEYNKEPPDFYHKCAFNCSIGTFISSNQDLKFYPKGGSQFSLFLDLYSINNNNLDPQKGTLKQPYPRNLLSNFSSFAFNEKDKILYGTYASQNYIRKINFLDHNQVDYFKAPLIGNYLYFFEQGAALIYSSPDGIFKYSESGGIPLLTDPEFERVSCFYGEGSYLWIGTENHGLYRYNFNSTEVKKILNKSHINCIKPGKAGELLVATNNGIYVISKTEEEKATRVHYSTFNGLPSNEIKDVHGLGDSLIYAISAEGILIIDRFSPSFQSLSNNDLSLKDIQVNNNYLNADSAFFLNHKENNITFHYELIDYVSSGNILYYTRLLPISQDWQATKDRRVNYLSLNPGTYTFELKAKNLNGNEVILESPVHFTIKKPYYETLLFQILIGIISMLILLSIVAYRDKVQRRKLKFESDLNRKMAQLELSALKAQMNPHFVFNALGAIQYYIQTQETENADRYLTKFARLMRMYLEWSREQFIPLNKEIELLTFYTELEKLRFEDLFEVNIHVDPEINTEEMELPSLFIQPFVENAVIHGLQNRRDGKGKLNIRFLAKEELIHCIIEDNGVGRNNAAKKKRKKFPSKGMMIIQEKIQTLKASGLMDIDIEIQDLNPSDLSFPGTQVVLNFLPLEVVDY